MAVQPAEPGDGERRRRDLPRKADARDEIGLHRLEQRCDPGAARGHHDVELRRHLVQHSAEIEAPVAALRVTDRQERDRLVPRIAQRGVQPEHRGQDSRRDDDAQHHYVSRKTRAPEDWFRAFTTISSMFTCQGRVRAHITQSAMSSAVSGSIPW